MSRCLFSITVVALALAVGACGKGGDDDGTSKSNSKSRARKLERAMQRVKDITCVLKPSSPYDAATTIPCDS